MTTVAAAIEYPYVATDAAGSEITVERPLSRVISLNRQTSECIVLLGAREKIIATGDATVRNNPHLALEGLPEMAGTGFESMEAILALNPDAVFAYRDRSPHLESRLAGSGIKVIRLDNNKPETEDEELLLLGTLLERREEAEEILKWRKALRDLAESKLADIPATDRKTVAAFLLSPILANGTLRLYPARDSNGSPGPGEGYAAILAGGADAFPAVTSEPDSATGTVLINDEYLLKINPEVITFHGSIYGGYAGPDAGGIQAVFENVKKISSVRLTDACLSGRLYFFHTDMLGGNKKEIGTLQLMKYLYPDLMRDVEPLDYAKDYFENKLGVPFKGTWFHADGDT
jgi:iron complex transport system substrate-binding protein